MKTVHEYLCEIDSEELANQYMVDFPPDDLEWLSHKDMLIGEYYDHRKQAIRTFIDKLRSIKPCQSEDGETKIFIAYRVIEDFCKDVDFSMVYEKELKEDLSNVKFYSCILVPHEEILGYYVANNKLTQHYLHKLLSFLIHEALIIGFEQERREEIIRSLEEAEEQAKNHPESLLSMEEVDQMLHEEFGYIPDTDKETDEEEELRGKAGEAQMKYSDFSKKKELEELLRDITGSANKKD
jgi:hypothetical protein